MLEIYKIRNTYTSLNTRTRALRAAKPTVTPSAADGYELQDTAATAEKAATSSTSSQVQTEEVKTLRKDWSSWRNALVVNS